MRLDRISDGHAVKGLAELIAAATPGSVTGATGSRFVSRDCPNQTFWGLPIVPKATFWRRAAMSRE